MSWVVGMILMAINQGDAGRTGARTPVLLWKVPPSYVASYAVTTVAALPISRLPR